MAFRKWEKKILELHKEVVVTKEKEVEEEKKVLLEYVWEHLPPVKLSGNTYVRFNENLGKIPGRDNAFGGLAVECDPGLVLSDYTFLYRFQNVKGHKKCE